MKQRNTVLQNIAEAREQLEAIEKSLGDPEYEEIALQVDLEHAYHHLNFAWNVRDASDSAVAALSDEDFAKWSKFPIDDMQPAE